jgi:hypothetical protein
MAVCSRDSRAEVLKGRSLREYHSAMRDGFAPINSIRLQSGSISLCPIREPRINYTSKMRLPATLERGTA